MTRNARIVVITATAIAAVLLVVAIFVHRDLSLRRGEVVPCPDGSHSTIDMREFSTRYWAYSAKLEASISDKAKISTEIDPKVLSNISESLQEANEFRKYVVAGYNSCAITQAQYAQFGARFHALDGLAQEINASLAKTDLSHSEQARLADLVQQYVNLAKQLGSQ